MLVSNHLSLNRAKAFTEDLHYKKFTNRQQDE